MRRLKGSSLQHVAEKQRQDRVLNLAWNLFWAPACVPEKDKKLLRRCKLAQRIQGVTKLTAVTSKKVYDCYAGRYAPK